MNIPYKWAFSRFHIQTEGVIDIGTYSAKRTKFDASS
jgi:hypothetical protein